MTEVHLMCFFVNALCLVAGAFIALVWYAERDR